MKKLTSLAVGAALLSASAFAVVANAQTAGSATVPVFYNSVGQAVNDPGTGTLAAGYYYTATPASASDQIYYYGNGTYYDPSTMTYGGTVSDPTGAAGTYYNTVVAAAAPGAPNTGAGGEAPLNWAVLIVSGIVAIVGVTYLTRRASLRVLG